jgi:hypothetical protein
VYLRVAASPGERGKGREAAGKTGTARAAGGGGAGAEAGAERGEDSGRERSRQREDCPGTGSAQELQGPQGARVTIGSDVTPRSPEAPGESHRGGPSIRQIVCKERDLGLYAKLVRYLSL